jgi:hypothetical protein
MYINETTNFVTAKLAQATDAWVATMIAAGIEGMALVPLPGTATLSSAVQTIRMPFRNTPACLARRERADESRGAGATATLHSHSGGLLDHD